MIYIKKSISFAGAFIMCFGIMAVFTAITYHNYQDIPTLSGVAVFGFVIWQAAKENSFIKGLVKKMMPAKSIDS